MSAIATVRAANKKLTLDGKHAVVVGGTSGIGHGIAVRLAQAGANVSIVGRSKERGEKICKEMEEKAPRRDDGSSPINRFRFLPCDCFSLADVKSTAEKIKADTPTLDILVCTQGMATLQGFTPTDEGLDQKLTLHVFSRAAFVHHLRESMMSSTDPRFFTVLSAGIHGSYANYENDPSFRRARTL